MDESVSKEESLEVGAGLHLAYSPAALPSSSTEQVECQCQSL